MDAWRGLARGAAAARAVRELDPATRAALARTPEVRRVLALPRLRDASDADLERLLTHLLVDRELQEATRAGAVTDEMVSRVLDGGDAVRRLREAFGVSEARAAEALRVSDGDQNRAAGYLLDELERQ